MGRPAAVGQGGPQEGSRREYEVIESPGQTGRSAGCGAAGQSGRLPDRGRLHPYATMTERGSAGHRVHHRLTNGRVTSDRLTALSAHRGSIQQRHHKYGHLYRNT